MKKLLWLLVVLLMPLNIKAISASASIAMDLNTGRIFHENNIDEARLIASITKIMTAIVAIEHGKLEQVVTVDEEVLKAYGSAIYIEVGEKIKLKDLLYGLMLRSGNDAAVVIAKTVAGSMPKFADLMNETAQKIGMKNTNFVNAHGLEENDGRANKSSAYDMAILTKYAVKNKTFKEIFGTKKKVVETNYKTYSWTNKNRLLHSYEYATGGKTGFTQKARRTLVTTASKNNVDVVIVTLNDPNDFQDHKDLYEEIFSKYTGILVIDKDNFQIKKEKLYQEATLYVKNNVYVPVLENEKNKLSIKYELYKKGHFENNDKIGTAKIYIGETLIHEEPIYILNKKKTKVSFWDKVKGWFKKW